MKINMNYDGLKGKSFKLNKKAFGALAVSASFLVLFSACTKSNNKKNTNESETTTVAVIDTVDLASLGNKLDIPSAEELTQPVYGNVTGDVDVAKIVRGSDGSYYATKEDADKSKDVGKTTYDTKGGKYTVTSDGKVKDSTPGYQITDRDGKVVDSGNSDVPDGYYEVSKGVYLPIGYVYADATYYAADGNIAIKKGDVVAEETLEYAKAHFSTTKPETTTASSTTTL